MDKLIAYAIAAASFFNAVKTIVDFYKERVKKPVDNVISRNIKQEIAPVTSELKEINSMQDLELEEAVERFTNPATDSFLTIFCC